MVVGTSRRDVLTALAVCGCGLAWVAQLFLPWAGEGALSASSGADVWRLSRDGLLPSGVDRVVPALVVLPALGITALVLAGVSGRRWRFARLALVLAGLAVGVVLVAALGSRLDGHGPGLVLTVVASGMAAVVVAGEVIGPMRSASADTFTEAE